MFSMAMFGLFACQSKAQPAAPNATRVLEEMQVRCPPRRRKSWNDMTVQEKASYNNAILASMNSGAYGAFAAQHAYLFGSEIHQTCAFLFWHRAFLLAFENMLRSMPRYRCVTIPYFDYVRDSIAFRARRCTNLLACSSIARELGTGPGFMGRFVRADWRRTRMVMEMSHLSIQNYLFPTSNSVGVDRVSSDLELYVHNAVHSAFGGDMSAQFSPRDPMFFSHHATIDLFHTIFYNCQGSRTAIKNWSNCRARNRSPITQGTTVNRQQSRSSVARWINVPRHYGALTDVRRLGYSYQISSGPLRDMSRTCGRRQLRRQLTELELMSMAENVNDDSNATNDVRMNATNLTSAIVYGLSNTTEAKPVLIAYDKEIMWQNNLTALCQAQGLDANATRLEIEKIVTLLYQNCLPGDVKDYSDVFKDMMHLEDDEVARGFEILGEIKNGTDPIQLPREKWTAINMETYGCRGDKHVIA
jgi:hypothetical protein